MNFGMASRVRACSKDATGGGQGGSTNICVNWERGTGNREQGTEDREQSARATAKEHSEIGHAGVRFDWLAVGERKKSMECSRLRGGAAALEDGGEGVANEFQACGWCGDIDGDELCGAASPGLAGLAAPEGAVRVEGLAVVRVMKDAAVALAVSECPARRSIQGDSGAAIFS
jgi:hypothetical protein